MRIFRALYAWTIRWASHPRAPWALGGLSFAESSFFPIPPDALLVPMSLAQPRCALRFALITTVGSLLGGLVGYGLGYLALHLVEPWLRAAELQHAYQTAVAWFERWGFWVVLVAGFSPVPYKVFTVAAGATGVPLVPFLAGSLLGRGARFFLVASLVAWGGTQLEPWLLRNVERLGWATVLALIIGVVWLQYG